MSPNTEEPQEIWNPPSPWVQDMTFYQKFVRVGDQKWEIIEITIRITFFAWDSYSISEKWFSIKLPPSPRVGRGWNYASSNSHIWITPRVHTNLVLAKMWLLSNALILFRFELQSHNCFDLTQTNLISKTHYKTYISICITPEYIKKVWKVVQNYSKPSHPYVSKTYIKTDL